MSGSDPEPSEAFRRTVEARHPVLAGGRWQVLAGGLIHRTFRVDAPAGCFVVQEVSPIFDPVVHEDIEAVTAHLTAAGHVTPRLVRTADGALWVDVDGRIVRVLTHLDGTVADRVTSPALARAAGEALGRFHAALADLDHTFRSRRIAHDPARHVAAMLEAVAARRGHRLHGPVAALADEIAAAARTLPGVAGHPRRIVHGDPKITNLLLVPGSDPPRPLAWVDLDTCGRQVLAYEIGDALRSWCNPRAEDDPAAAFDVDAFAAAVEGYVSAGPRLDASEVAGLVWGVEAIALELAARFCRDALEESYFGWDRRRFPASGEHQLARARGQWALFESARARRRERERIVRDLLG